MGRDRRPTSTPGATRVSSPSAAGLLQDLLDRLIADTPPDPQGLTERIVTDLVARGLVPPDIHRTAEPQ